MFKDPDKQREANRQAKSRQRLRDNEPQGMTIIDERPDEPSNVIPKSDIRVIPERTAQGNIRVSKPGDADYVPQCETTRAFIEDRDKRPETAKRGKDIKTFEDLSPDVQQTIRKLSTDKVGLLNQREFINRTAIAINYQHLFPGRFHSVGLAERSPI